MEGARGERRTRTELGVVGAYPDGLVYFEGRAAALVAEDAHEHRLAEVRELHAAERVALQVVRGAGAPVSSREPARLGRIDLASEMRFADGREGAAFLHVLAALDVPWCKVATDGRKAGAVETVSAHGTRGRTVYVRAYDKGVEAGTDAPGRRVRVERQKRYRKSKEPHVAQFSALDLRSVYLGREFTRLAELPSVVVCDLADAVRVVRERATSSVERDALVGFLVCGREGHLRSTFFARSAQLRAMGVALDPAAPERLSIPIGRYLQALASAWPQAA